jgi:UDP-N-acetylglucosamine--N-acetylmuramyl-(pentapeptide) pyrophosphoryl-undecaprenol N-acetylglucosamine transferase
MRILFAGGLSVGHLAPLVAVWREVKTMDPQAEALFVCSNKEEDKTYLQSENVTYIGIDAPRRSLLLPWQLLKAWMQAKKVVREFGPAVVFSKGGSASVGVCLEAARRSIPIVLHESDSVSGWANAFISKRASVRCKGFPVTQEKNDAWIYTGNPVRSSMMEGSKERGRALTGFTDDKPVLLIIGGSQGAQAINEMIVRHIDELLPHYNIAHITGRGKERNIQRPGYWHRTFVGKELADLYAITTVAVSRAGAGALSELAMHGIPTVCIPLEGVAHNHQVKNAEVMEREHACVYVKQRSMNQELVPLLLHLASSSEEREKLSTAILKLARPDAAKEIATLLLECARREKNV